MTIGWICLLVFIFCTVMAVTMYEKKDKSYVGFGYLAIFAFMFGVGLFCTELIS